MSFEFLKKLPTPKEICEQYPVSEKVARIKKERDLEIKKVITGASDKFLVIIGSLVLLTMKRPYVTMPAALQKFRNKWVTS